MSHYNEDQSNHIQELNLQIRDLIAENVKYKKTMNNIVRYSTTESEDDSNSDSFTTKKGRRKQKKKRVTVTSDEDRRTSEQ